MDLEPTGRTDLVDHSDTGTPRPPLNPEATNEHERKASAGQFSGDDPILTCHPSPSQRNNYDDQSRADATPPNDKRQGEMLDSGKILQTNTDRTRETGTQPTHNDWRLANRIAANRIAALRELRESSTAADGSAAAAAAAHQSSKSSNDGPIRCVTQENLAGGHESNHQRHHSSGETLFANQKGIINSSILPMCYQQQNVEHQQFQRSKDIADAQNIVDNALGDSKRAYDAHDPENQGIEEENPNAHTRQDDSSGAPSGPAHSANDELNLPEDAVEDDRPRQREQNDAMSQTRHDLLDEHREQLKLAHERVRNQCLGQGQERVPLIHRPSDDSRLASHLSNGRARQNNDGRKKSATPTTSAAPVRSGAEWFEFNVARASSLEQLQSMRHRLKALLGQCEARIKTELVKVALEDHLAGNDGPRAVARGDEDVACCPLCLSTENDSRVSCPTCEQDYICKYCTGM